MTQFWEHEPHGDDRELDRLEASNERLRAEIEALKAQLSGRTNFDRDEQNAVLQGDVEALKAERDRYAKRAVEQDTAWQIRAEQAEAALAEAELERDAAVASNDLLKVSTKQAEDALAKAEAERDDWKAGADAEAAEADSLCSRLREEGSFFRELDANCRRASLDKLSGRAEGGAEVSE